MVSHKRCLSSSPFLPFSRLEPPLTQNRSTLTKTVSPFFLILVIWCFCREVEEGEGRYREPSFVCEGADGDRPVLLTFLFPSCFFFLFWSKGLFRTGTLGDYLMEVEHAEMSGIGESREVGGIEGTRRVVRVRKRGRRQKDSRIDREEGFGTTGVPRATGTVLGEKPPSETIPPGTIKYLTGVFSGFTVRRRVSRADVCSSSQRIERSFIPNNWENQPDFEDSPFPSSSIALPCLRDGEYR